MRKALALVVLLAACGGGDDNEGDLAEAFEEASNGPPCEEVFADGAPLDAALDALDTGCVDSDGEALLLSRAFYDCTDGGQLSWNDEGWGMDAEGIWHHHDREDGQLVPPDDVLAACRP